MAKALLNSVEDESNPARLLRACIQGDVTAIQELSADFSVKGLVDFETARTALHFVVFAGEAAGKCAEILLEAGCPDDVADIHGLSPLMLAYMYGSRSMIDLFASRPETARIPGGPYGPQAIGSWTNLMRACYSNKVAQIKHCLSSGDDVDASSTFGQTALHSAIHRGNSLAVEMLVGAGCNVNKQDAFGWTPLMITCRRGWIDLTTRLLDSTANMHIRDCEGHNVADTALLQGNTKILSCLMQYDPSIFSCADQKFSPVQIATACLNQQLLGWITEDGVPISRSLLGEALHTAIKLGHFAIMRALVSLGATIMESHVAEAVKRENFEFCQYLISCGVNLTRGSNSLVSPLVIACHRSNLRCVRLLVDAGVRPHAKEGSEDISTIPLAIALLKGNSTMVYELLRAGADPDIDKYCVTTTGMVCETDIRSITMPTHRPVESLPREFAESVRLCLQAGATYSLLSRLWHNGEGVDPFFHVYESSQCRSLQNLCAAQVWQQLLRTVCHGSSFVHVQHAIRQLTADAPFIIRETLMFPYALHGRSVLSQLCRLSEPEQTADDF